MRDDEVNMTRMRIILNGLTFGQRKAEKIVGGRLRLTRLISRGFIRCERKSDKQNAKWFCNAWDCIKYAKNELNI